MGHGGHGGHGAQVARRDFRIGMPTTPWNNRRRVIDPPSKPITTPPAPLEYDRTPNHVTRGQFRVLLFMVFINTVAIVGYVCVPGGSQWARQTWADYQNKRAAKAKEQRVRDAANKRIADFQKALPLLAAMKLPADTPVYTEDGVEAASLLASDPAYETVPFDRRGMQVSVWQAAVGRGELPQAKPLFAFIGDDPAVRHPISIFLHARKNPAGEDRLALCEMEASQLVREQTSDTATIQSTRLLMVRLIAPGSATEPPKVLTTVLTEFDQRPGEQAKVKIKDNAGSNPNAASTPQTFRMLAGVPDASDATRFTIPYVINGAAGAFAVRIAEGDRVIVEPGEGRIAERSGGRTRVEQKWDLSAPQAVRVTESRP
jgi:hypothetical protein